MLQCNGHVIWASWIRIEEELLGHVRYQFMLERSELRKPNNVNGDFVIADKIRIKIK
jgi:hypothetical protein